MLLGVNIDHIAVLREARKINDPDPLDALGIARRAGADQITIHLREDRRHIHDEDAKRIVENSHLPVNIECSIDPDIIEYIAELRPQRITLVPENREEVTTEGGLNIEAIFSRLDSVVHFMKAREIEVSLFIDPTIHAVKAAKTLGVEWVELHTGHYANLYATLHSNLSRTHHAIESLNVQRSKLRRELSRALESLEEAAKEAESFGIRCAAGHGLNYQNVTAITAIAEIVELNIGQSIIARSVFTGLEQAIAEMKRLIKRR